MRAIGEIPNQSCKITLFDWNQKYLIKLELGLCEQTYKISHLDIGGEKELRALLTPEFIAKAMARFDSMHEDLGSLL